MPSYYFTVGQRYAREEHPLNLHPDGYAVIENAPDEFTARALFNSFAQGKWAGCYTAKEMEELSEYHPRGCMWKINYEDKK